MWDLLLVFPSWPLKRDELNFYQPQAISYSFCLEWRISGSKITEENQLSIELELSYKCLFASKTSDLRPTPAFPWWAQSSHSSQGEAPTAHLWSYCLEWRSSTFWAALILWWLSVLYFACLALHSTGQDCNCSVQDPHEFRAEQSEVDFHLLKSLSRDDAPKLKKSRPSFALDSPLLS